MCKGYFQKYYFNKEIQNCEKFVYGGCGGNSNNFESEIACKSTCMSPNDARNINEDKNKQNDKACQLPKKTGLCRAMMKRVYFNSEIGKCEPFVYGGCQGNENNFMSVEECETKCPLQIASGRNSKSISGNICGLQKMVGPCRALIPRFFFNVESKKCESFFYGGCQGNENNFESEDECKNACGDFSSGPIVFEKKSEVNGEKKVLKGKICLN
jgi:hypothetical protein